MLHVRARYISEQLVKKQVVILLEEDSNKNVKSSYK